MDFIFDGVLGLFEFSISTSSEWGEKKIDKNFHEKLNGKFRLNHLRKLAFMNTFIRLSIDSAGNGKEWNWPELSVQMSI